MQRVAAKQSQALIFIALIIVIIIGCLIGTGWYLFTGNTHAVEKKAQTVAELWNMGNSVKNLI